MGTVCLQPAQTQHHEAICCYRFHPRVRVRCPLQPAPRRVCCWSPCCCPCCSCPCCPCCSCPCCPRSCCRSSCCLPARPCCHQAGALWPDQLRFRIQHRHPQAPHPPSPHPGPHCPQGNPHRQRPHCQDPDPDPHRQRARLQGADRRGPPRRPC